jgi:hypothetical protein
MGYNIARLFMGNSNVCFWDVFIYFDRLVIEVFGRWLGIVEFVL